MTHKNYFILCLAAVICSFLLFAYQKEYIIINFGKKIDLNHSNTSAQKKNATLYYWNHHSWNTEQVSLLFSENYASNLQQLTSRWLQLLHEEKITKKKISLQSSAITYDGQELIISFDRMPWNKEMSTHEKWMIIESLLKTIKNSDSHIKRVRFLVNQQIPLDSHLDFTNAWPIEGFSS